MAAAVWAKVAGAWQKVAEPATPAWTQRLNSPLTATSEVTTAGGVWTIVGGQLSVAMTGFADTRALAASGTLLQGYAHIVECEFEIPTGWGTDGGRYFGLSFDDNLTGTIMLVSAHADGTLRLDNGNSAAWVVPAAGTWVKIRAEWNGYDKWSTWLDGVSKHVRQTPGNNQTFSTSMKALIKVQDTAARNMRMRNLKVWSLAPVQP